MGPQPAPSKAYDGFADRLQKAMEMNPNAPPKYHGERVWLAEKLEQAGSKVSTETVRKWLSGETLPRHKKIEILARILGVDTNWLIHGDAAAAEAVQRAKHSYDAGATTNILAGIIQQDGGDALFPPDDMADAAPLTAVLQRVSYPIEPVAATINGDKMSAAVSTREPRGLLLAVARDKDAGSFAFRVFEIREEQLDGCEVSRGHYHLEADAKDLREVTSFADRL